MYLCIKNLMHNIHLQYNFKINILIFTLNVICFNIAIGIPFNTFIYVLCSDLRISTKNVHYVIMVL